MRLILIDCGSKRLPALIGLLGGQGADVTSVPLIKANDHDYSVYGAGVISGGPHLFTTGDSQQLIDKFTFIDTFNLPLLGICLGHQAIGIRLGSNVYRGEARRELETLYETDKHPLLDGVGPEFNLQADHCEGINCPACFTSIARSDYYENEIMVNDSRRFYGIQSHPETSGETGERLISNFLTLAFKLDG